MITAAIEDQERAYPHGAANVGALGDDPLVYRALDATGYPIPEELVGQPVVRVSLERDTVVLPLVLALMCSLRSYGLFCERCDAQVPSPHQLMLTFGMTTVSAHLCSACHVELRPYNLTWEEPQCPDDA